MSCSFSLIVIFTIFSIFLIFELGLKKCARWPYHILLMTISILQDFLLKINYLKQLKNLKNLNFNKIQEYNFLKMMKFSKAIYLQTHGLIQKKIEFNDIYTDGLLDTQHNKLSSKVERQAQKMSGWTINSIMQY